MKSLCTNLLRRRILLGSVLQQRYKSTSLWEATKPFFSSNKIGEGSKLPFNWNLKIDEELIAYNNPERVSSVPSLAELEAVNQKSSHSLNIPSYLESLDQETRALFPHRHGASVGHVEGRFLAAASKLKKPKRVLELGCFAGYSALCLAEGMDLRCPSKFTGDSSLDAAISKALNVPEEKPFLPETFPATVLVTCDTDVESLSLAEKYFKASPFPDKLFRLYHASPEAMISQLVAAKEEPFDLIFLDADKKSQERYFEAIIKGGLLAPDGVMIIDNMLYQRKIAPNAAVVSQEQHSRIAKSIQKFSKNLASDPRYNYLMLPLFDGIGLVMNSGNKNAASN